VGDKKVYGMIVIGLQDSSQIGNNNLKEIDGMKKILFTAKEAPRLGSTKNTITNIVPERTAITKRGPSF